MTGIALLGVALGGGAIGPALAVESVPPASATCPAAFPAQPPALPADRPAELVRIEGLAEACRDRAGYFAYLGVLMLTQQRPQEAALALEKALLLDPELAGTQLDYAQALAELGDLASAVSLADEVSQRPDIPLALQAWLSTNLDAWRGDSWRADWSIDVLAGGESNLNSAPGIRFLTLTLPGGSVPFELAASAKPRSGGALRTILIGSAVRSLGRGLLLFAGEFTARNSPSHSDTNQSLVSANAAYVQPALGGQLGLRVVQTRLWIGNEPTYNSSGWRLLYHLPESLSFGRCGNRLGYGAESLDFPGASLQAGRYTGAEAWLSCRSEDWQIDFGLQDGNDRPSHATRPGGAQRRSDLILGVARKLGAATLSLWMQRGRATDELPYSPLLGDQARRMDRLTSRLFYEHPVVNQWSIVGYAESTSQKSNIDLFKMDNNAIYLGLRWRGL